MPRLSNDFKQAIEEIPVRELQKLVMQAAARSQEFYDMINIQYVSGKQAEIEILEEAKDRALGELYFLDDRGVLQKNLAKAIGKAVKHINHYVKVSGNQVGEAELLHSLLDEIFKDHSNELGTCWTVYDSKLAITTNRFYNLVAKKLHEDYLIEYKEPINEFLKTLHSKSNHLNFVYDMPNTI
jgi:hypothetical protein